MKKQYLGLCCVILCVGIVQGQQQLCSDCRVVRDCPDAQLLSDVKTPENNKKLRDAFCGYEGNSLKVCCLALNPKLDLLPKDCGEFDGEIILSGRETGLYEFPWMALISVDRKSGRSWGCLGSVINSRYILTAAQCLKNITLAGVRIGEHDISKDSDCQYIDRKMVCETKIQDIHIEETIFHDGFQGVPNVKNDIGLLRLKKDIDFTRKNAKPICLPVTESMRLRNLANATAAIAGWGSTETGYGSDVLLAADVPVWSKERCSELYNGKSRKINKQLCAGGEGNDACGGDSGGPLMIPGLYHDAERYIQYGIVSFGPRLCGSSTYPSVYTDVSGYMDWILDNIKP